MWSSPWRSVSSCTRSRGVSRSPCARSTMSGTRPSAASMRIRSRDPSSLAQICARMWRALLSPMIGTFPADVAVLVAAPMIAVHSRRPSGCRPWPLSPGEEAGSRRRARRTDTDPSAGARRGPQPAPSRHRHATWPGASSRAATPSLCRCRHDGRLSWFPASAHAACVAGRGGGRSSSASRLRTSRRSRCRRSSS